MIGGRYALRAAIGHGGMGTVWRGSDTLLRREVAVKEVVSPPGLAPSDREAMFERTLREARAAAALSHPSVVQVYDVVTENGRPWIVMELLDARSLADMVIDDGPLAPRAVAKIGIALLGALEVAHAIGVLHRDVKPANVLICADGRCVLTDFGVARMPTDVQLTTPGMVLGSPHFISPERAMGEAFGPPSDLFSLGVTLFTAIEGHPPFDKGDPIETMHAVVEDPPLAPVRAAELTRVLYGLLEKDPARRWDVNTARGVLRELLAGPLASAARDHITDPYAVVPVQRASWSPPPPPKPKGQIGGRAMLAPGESLTDRIRSAGTPRPDPATDPDRTAPHPTAPHAATPHAATPHAITPHAAAPPPTAAVPRAAAYGAPRPGGGTYRPEPRPAGQHAAHADHSGGMLTDALDGVRGVGSGLADGIRRWPAKVKIAAGAGLAVGVLLATIAAANVWGGGGDPVTTAAGPAPAPTQPLIPTQPASHDGIEVNVPEGWKRSSPQNAVYVDFVDPEDSGRKVRILVEDATAKPARFLQIAENGLKGNSRSCADPYDRVDLRDAELAGQAAAELEYTCGDGEAMRHGIWRAVVQDGKAYSFYLSSQEERFAESAVIFDEMVRSFRIAPAN